jgi:hypothetical protein
MGSHHPFEHLKHNLWPKERSGFTYVQVTCNIPLESSWWGLQLFFKPHYKVIGPQSRESPNSKNFETPIWSPETKCHLDVALWRGAKYTTRGKVVASPKFGPWWVLWIWICPWLVLTLKRPKLCTNQLLVWFVQIYVSDWTLVILVNPIPELQHALLPPKCYELKSVLDFLVFWCFHFRLSI